MFFPVDREFTEVIPEQFGTKTTYIPGGNMKHTQKNSKEILFQKLGNTWYAFTEVNEDVIYSTLPDGMDPRETKLEFYEIIEEHMQKVANIQNKVGLDSVA